MNRREHLILSILITTGCRLDEAALLCWDNIIEHEEGWHYIDLRTALVKNTGSKRLLPIPDCLCGPSQRGHKVSVEGISNSPDGSCLTTAWTRMAKHHEQHHKHVVTTKKIDVFKA